MPVVWLQKQMETCRDTKQLVDSSSDGSFELVDPNFDDSYYNELRGVAKADYIPMEKGEVLLRKGLSFCQLLPTKHCSLKSCM